MVELYSLKRPGRPRWLLAASTLLLLLTVFLAWGLIRYKGHVDFGETQLIADERLQIRLPLGWEPVPSSKQLSSEGILALLKESTHQQNARILMLFTGSPGRLNLPSDTLNLLYSRLRPVLESIKRPGQFTPPVFVTDGRVGNLPSVTIEFDYRFIELYKSGEGIVKRQRNIPIVARIGVSPAGEAVGLAVVSTLSTGRADNLLIEKLSSHIQLLPAKSAESPSSALKKAGLKLEIPSKTEVQSNTEGLPQVNLMGGTGQHSWYLTIHRVPLAAKRTPQELVEDHVLSLFERDQLPVPAQAQKIQEREATWFEYGFPAKLNKWLMVASVATDANTALLLVGRCEGKGKPFLTRNMQRIIGQAEADSYAPLLPAALQQGQKLLQEIESKGLSHYWSRQTVQTRDYRITYSNTILGHVSQRIAAEPKDGLWWSMETKVSSIEAGGTRPRQQENWLIRDDLSAYQLEYRQPDMQYSEIKRPGSNEIIRERMLQGQSASQTKLATGEGLACEPVLFVAAGLLARDAQQKEAIFATIETFTHDRTYWRMVSVGRKSVPGQEREASAIRVYRDHSPSPITFYFDEKENLLLALEFANGIRRELEQ